MENMRCSRASVFGKRDEKKIFDFNRTQVLSCLLIELEKAQKNFSYSEKAEQRKILIFLNETSTLSSNGVKMKCGGGSKTNNASPPPEATLDQKFLKINPHRNPKRFVIKMLIIRNSNFSIPYLNM